MTFGTVYEWPARGFFMLIRQVHEDRWVMYDFEEEELTELWVTDNWVRVA